MKYFVSSVTFLFLVIACKQSENKRILYKGEIAEGLITVGKDTTFSGDIQFYDSTGTILRRIQSYKNNLPDGPSIYYYPNGRTSIQTNYSQGKENGYAILYDTVGDLFQKVYYFHDACFGPLITYQNNRLKRYTFYSFDGFVLMSIEYDSIRNKKVSEWQDRLIYLNRSYETKNVETNEASSNYFIYLLSPPEYPFKYTLCQVDSANNVLEEVKRFDYDKVWDTFEITHQEGAKKLTHAIKLEVYHNKKIIWTDFKKVE